MQIKYLGTGAAEGIPAVFCRCKICQHARESKGHDIRTRAQALIDNNILLDFGPDTYSHSLTFNIDLSTIYDCLITHAHDDHLYVEDIRARRRSRANLPEGTSPLKIYGGKGVKNALSPTNDGYITKNKSVIFCEVIPFSPFTIGQDYTITALPAIHKSEEPYVYIIKKNNKTFLYGHDTDIFDDEVWNYLKETGTHFDAASLDCTEGMKDISYKGHMNFERLKYMREKMRENKLINTDTIMIANHISHNGLITHKQAESMAKDIGYIVAFDGMEINL